MTNTRRGRGLLAVSAVSATTVLAMTVSTGALAAKPTASPDPAAPVQSETGAKERKGNYDARTPNLRSTYARAAKVLAKETTGTEKFRDSLGSQGVVSLDPNTGTPEQVSKLNGFLTAASTKKPADVVLGYVKSHPDIFKLSASDLGTLKLRKSYVDNLGTTHLSWLQVVDGIEVFGNGLQAHVTKKGQIISIQGSPVAGVIGQAQGAAKRAVTLTASEARITAAKDLDTMPKSAEATKSGATTKWKNGDYAKQVWFVTGNGLRKGWSTYVNAGGDLLYTHVVDAETGSTLYRRDLVSHANGDGLVQDNYPGAAKGGTQVVKNFYNLGFLPKGAKTLDKGYWVQAYADINDDNKANAGETVKAPGTATGAEYKLTPFAGTTCTAAFVCTWDPAKADSWRTNLNQDVTNGFYLASNFHNYLRKPPISFTAAAGNFERNGGDPVVLNALDGANTANGLPDVNHQNNANMGTPPDGNSPLMQMYLFGGDGIVSSSSSNDAAILYHEYTHGLSNRLVVDASGNSTLNSIQAGAMGEAWSDYYALDYLVSQGFETDTTAAGEVLEGKYVLGGDTIRTQAIDCRVRAVAKKCVGIDGSQGGYTYADFPTVGGAPQVHASGEIWAQTMWDIRERLGRTKANLLITRAMELSAADPTMLDMRNAVIQADWVAHNGANNKVLWQVFANRGMGWFAGAVDGGDAFPAEDFHLPPSAPGASVSGTVTDKVTGQPVQGALVFIGGHDSGYTGDYSDVTGADGKYSFDNVLPGTYPKVVVAGGGYEFLTQPVTVKAGGTTANFSPRRNWASASGGGKLASFTGPDYSSFGCGPAGAIDGAQGTGWGSTTGDDAGTPTNTPIPKNIVVDLPEDVTINTFSIDPSPQCGDPGSASTGGYKVETSADGTTWATAAEGTFTAANRGKYNEVPATANNTGVKHIRFWMLSPQVPDIATNCPDGGFAGCSFMDMAEIQVFGTK